MDEVDTRNFTCVSESSEPLHYHVCFRLPPGTRLLNKLQRGRSGPEPGVNSEVR
ncbi:hypothetical protein FHS27_004082 [Rhodopirellula rubra]|uniref:Uncharacterized protein n=1 Tax=Aporhodopirellula rubra TaxID=980271 RepID=A0A7W5H7P1_9BACT|nr:hypothetical protein [Aporhodopirellula rubra]